MQHQKTHKRIILGIELESRAEVAAIIGVMVLCACLAVIAAVVINVQVYL